MVEKLNVANNFETQLAHSINNTVTEFDVLDATGAPAVPFILRISETELIKVTAISGDTITAERGQEGTAPVAHLVGAKVENTWTAGQVDNLYNYGYRYVQTLYFTTNDTFEKADYSWLSAVRVKLSGGGGGGGGAATTGEGENAVASGGGGAAYAESFIDANVLSSSVGIVVGAGGNAGVAGSNAGGAGGESSFGEGQPYEVSAEGGAGGAGGAATSSVPGISSGGGTPGRDGVGDLVIAGARTGARIYLTVSSVLLGNSGTSFLGSPSENGVTGSGANGQPHGEGFGAGGGGGANSENQSTARSGAVGAPGIVIIELYA